MQCSFSHVLLKDVDLPRALQKTEALQEVKGPKTPGPKPAGGWDGSYWGRWGYGLFA